VTSIAENIETIRSRVLKLEQEYQRVPGSVGLLAVSKRQSLEKIRAAHQAGCEDFGENYVQEALSKIELLSDLQLVWHFIGPIQSNKTKAIASSFQWVHSVDREKLASRLSEQRDPSLAPLNVCVQVNLSNEESKSGVLLEDVSKLCKFIEPLPGLKLRGLMAIPAPLQGLQMQRASFHPLLTEFEKLQNGYPDMDTLSIGMSADFEAAIAEGSTLVRIGTAIFGARD
jgi:PLP dependent protein